MINYNFINKNKKNFTKKRIAPKIISVLDIGNSKISFAIASVNKKQLVINGYACNESKAISRGSISDINIASNIIAKTIAKAEKIANFNISSIIVNISSNHSICKIENISVNIGSGQINNYDIKNIVAKIKNEYNKKQQEIIHLIALYYKIDDDDAEIENPISMFGNKLTGRFYIISVSQNILQNIKLVLSKSRLFVNSFVSSPYTLSLYASNNLPINNNINLIIDFGYNFTSISLISDSKFIYSNNIKLGSNLIIKDIMSIINIDKNIATKLLLYNNEILINKLDAEKFINFDEQIHLLLENNPNLQNLTKIRFSNIVESRIEDILENIKIELKKINIYDSISNIVISGGIADINKIDLFIEDYFKKKVIILNQKNLKLNFFSKISEEFTSSSFTTLFSMLYYGYLKKNQISENNINILTKIKNFLFLKY